MESHSKGAMQWCCVQAGHRERYGIPRALQRVGALDSLITDLWAPPDSWLSRLPRGRFGRKLRDRFHADLPRSKVRAFPLRTLAWETAASVRGLRGDRQVAAQNEWWVTLATRALRRQARPATGYLFSYCYASRALFTVARELGLTPVLGQIDPGPVEDAKVTNVVRRWPEFRTPFQPGSPEYYASWREECRLASRIIVNSEWSRTALEQAGLDAGKIVVCPLVYTPPPEASRWEKVYPASFSAERPLRVLFLGQCILRKGIAEAVEAARGLFGHPVEFTLVGNTDIAGLASHFGRARIRHVPRVSRAECHDFYREADVFLFPTHSDGFGLTQLEARAWKLPIIASPFCARVIEPGRTGWMLPEVSSRAIIQAVAEILANPAELTVRSKSITPWPFGLEQLGENLLAAVEAPLIRERVLQPA